MSSGQENPQAIRVIYCQAKASQAEFEVGSVTASVSHVPRPFQPIRLPMPMDSRGKSPILLRLLVEPHEVRPEFNLILSVNGRNILKQSHKVDWTTSNSHFLVENRSMEIDKSDYFVQNTCEEIANYVSFLINEGWDDGLIQAVSSLWESLVPPPHPRPIFQALNALLSPKYTEMQVRTQIFIAALYGVMGMNMTVFPGVIEGLVAAGREAGQEKIRTVAEKYREKMKEIGNWEAEYAMKAVGRGVAKGELTALWPTVRNTCKSFPGYYGLVEAQLLESTASFPSSDLPIYCLYRLNDDQISSVTLKLTSLNGFQQSFSLINTLPGSDLRLFSCRIPRKIETYAIILQQNDSIYPEKGQIVRKIPPETANFGFVFGLVFDLSFFRRLGRIAGVPQDEFRAYLRLFSSDIHFKSLYFDLSLQFLDFSQGKNLDPVTLFAVFSEVPDTCRSLSTSELLHFLSILTQLFSLNTEKILTFTRFLLNLNPQETSLFHQFQPKTAFLGLMKLTIASIEAKNGHWRRVIESFPVSKWNKVLIKESFEEVSDAVLKEFMEVLEGNGVKTGWKWWKAIMKRKQNTLLDHVKWLNIALLTKDCDLSAENAKNLFDKMMKNPYMFDPEKKPIFPLTDLIVAIEYLKTASKPLKTVLIPSQALLTAIISQFPPNKRSLETLELCKVLFKDGTAEWLLPGKDIKGFTEWLIVQHGDFFPFCKTYEAIYPACGKVNEVFAQWIKMRKVRSVAAWLQEVDTQLVEMTIPTAEMQLLAEETIEKLVEIERNQRDFLKIVTDYSIKTPILMSFFMKQAETYINQLMETHKTLENNELLLFFSRLLEKDPENGPLKSIISLMLERISPPNESIIANLLEFPAKQVYFPIIFTTFPFISTIQTANFLLKSFVLRINEGKIDIGTVFSILENDNFPLICKIFDISTNKTPFPLKDLLEIKRKIVENTRLDVKNLRDFIGSYFPELQDIHYFTHLSNEWTDNYRLLDLEATNLPENVRNLLVLFKNEEDGFRNQLKCQSFAEFVGQYKRSFENISSTHMRAVLELANRQLRNNLADVAGNLQHMQMERVLGLFSGVTNIHAEITLLIAIFPPNSVPSLRLPSVGQFIHEIRLKKRICEVLIKCKEILEFKNAEMMYVTAFLEEYNSINARMVVDFSVKSAELARDFDYKSFDESMLAALEALAANHSNLIGYLNDPHSIDKLKQQAAADDLSLDLDTVREIETVREFLTNVTGLNTVFDLQKRLKTMLTSPKFAEIDSKLFSVTQKIVQILHSQNQSKQVISFIVKNAKITFFKDAETRLELKYASNRVCDLRELQDLKAYSRIHVAAREKKSEEIERFEEFEGILERIIEGFEGLEEKGAPVPSVYNRQYVVINGKSVELEDLDRTLRDLMARWKDVTWSEYYELTYVPGRHLWEVENMLRTGQKSVQGEYWLEAIGKECDTNRPLLGLAVEPVERLKKLQMYLKELPELKARKRIPTIQPNEVESVLYDSTDILYIEAAEVFGAVLSLYQLTSQKFPKAHQLLFCQNFTRICDLRNFILHCVFSNKSKRIYTIICPEFLSLKRQIALKELIETSNVRKNSGTLAFISCDSKSAISDFLRTFSGRKVRIVSITEVVTNPSFLRKVAVQANPMVWVVSSAQAGLGKTTQIRRHSNRELAYVPLYGDLRSEDIVPRLKEMDVDSGLNLHIDIGYCESTQGIEYSLCQLILTGKVVSSDQSFSLPANTSIYIELSNIQGKNYVSIMPLLGYTQRIHIPELELELLEVGKEDGVVYACLNAYEVDISRLDGECPAPLVNREKAKELIQKHFLAFCKERSFPISYRAISTFTTLLKSLIASIFTPNIPSHFRPILFYSLLHTAKEYLSPITSRESQHHSLTSSPSPIPTTWEQSNHDALILSIPHPCAIYKHLDFTDTNIKTAARMLERQHIGASDTEIQLDDYGEMTSSQLLRKLQEMMGNTEEIEEKGYVLTVDNFLKMVLIAERAKFGLPIVIIGETGCGKTSLLRFLIEKVLKERLELISIHAGTSLEEIRERISEVKKEAKRGMGRIWVFFDEFNTSMCMGSVVEMVVSRSLEGQRIEDNVVLAAACNPYRVYSGPERLTSGLQFSQSNRPPLIHLVKILPDAILDHSWDFGALSAADMQKYIVAILSDLDLPHRDKFEALIYRAHVYYRNQKDVSSVSLRDITRFKRLYLWFMSSITSRKSMPASPYYSTNLKRMNAVAREVTDIPFESAILAFQLCYTIRLSGNDQRTEFLREVLENDFKIADIEAVIEWEEADILARMFIPVNTAVNEALKENVMVVFTGIYAGIPLIICGKPGCSKTLGTTLVFESCRGHYSADPYFKSLPELTPVPVQGSPTLTSLSISRVFERAKALKSITSGLFVVVIEEIGLAELSPHNPLKVLHKELDDTSTPFIGLSNWTLDASKMNRLLCLNRPDFSLTELETTALSLHLSSSRYDPRYKDLIKALARGYFSIRMDQQIHGYADFYGLRDFYSLVKQVTDKIPLFDGNSGMLMAKEVHFAVKRNFNGLKWVSNALWTSITHSWSMFTTLPVLPEIPVRSLITANIEDLSSRFLLLISRGEVTQYALKALFGRDVIQITGSTLPRDREEGAYALRCINNLVLCLDRPICLVLKDLEVIYSSLYDLFNQSYTQATIGRYVQIALGSIYNPRCKVDPQLRIIVLINASEESELKKVQTPFLNRFEKQTFEIAQLLGEGEVRVVERVEEWVKMVTKPIDPFVSLVHVFPTYCMEAVQLRIRENSDRDRLEDDSIFTEIKRELLSCASCDVLILAQLLGGLEGDWIQQTWRSLHPSLSFEALIRNWVTTGKNGVLFTYETDFSRLNASELSSFIAFNSLRNFNTEDDLKTAIIQCLTSTSERVFLLELDYITDFPHLHFVKSLIERLSYETHQYRCFLLIKLERNVHCAQFDSYFSSWSTFSLPSLSQPMDLTSYALSLSTKDLCLQPDFLNPSQNMDSLLWKVLLSFNYQPRNDLEAYINPHLYLLAENIPRIPSLRDVLIEKTKQSIEKIAVMQIEDWKTAVFGNGNIVSHSKSLKEAIKLALESCYQVAFSGVVYDLERKGVLGSYFTEWSKEIGAIVRNIWMENYQKEPVNVNFRLHLLPQSTPIPLNCILEFPFIYKDYHLLMRLKTEDVSTVPHWESVVDTYRERSILAGVFKVIQENKQLEGMYVRDLLRVHVANASLPGRYEKWLYRLLQPLVAEVEGFEQRVWTVLEAMDVGIVVCEIVEAMEEFDWEVGERVVTQVASLHDHYPESPMPIRTLFPEVDDIWVDIGLVKSPGAPPSQVSPFLQWKQLIADALLTAVPSVYPKHFTMKSVGSVALYLGKVRSIKQMFHRAEVMGVEIRSFDPLDFIVDLTDVFNRTKGEAERLESLCKHIKPSTGADFNPYNISELAYKKLNKILTTLYPNDPEAIMLYKAKFYSKWILFETKALPRFASDLETTANFPCPLWRFAYSPIRSILKMAGLDEVISNLKNVPDIRVNEYTQLLQTLLPSHSSLSVLLTDSIKDQLPSVPPLPSLTTYFPVFQKTVTSVPPSPLATLISAAVTSWYLDLYTSVLLTHTPSDILTDIDNLLSSPTEAANTLRLYVCKGIWTAGIRYEEIIQFKLRCEGVRWIKITELIPETTQGLPYIDISPSPNLDFTRFRTHFHHFLSSPALDFSLLSAIKQELNSVNTNEQKLTFSIAFLNEVLFAHWKKPTSIANLQPLKVDLESKLGPFLGRFLSLSVENFDEESILRVKGENSENEVHFAFALSAFLATTASFYSVTSAFTTPFFAKSPVFERDLYPLGAEIPPLYDYLHSVASNYTAFKATKTYKCSENCEFIYPIGNCGHPWSTFPCPYCGSTLGGTSHSLIPRAGHREVSDSEAVSLASEAVTAYMTTKQQPGHTEYGGIFWHESARHIRGIHPLTYRLLHLLLNLQIHFLTRIAPETAQNRVKLTKFESVNSYLNSVLGEDLREIVTLINHPESYLWLFRVISLLPGFMSQYSSLPTSVNARKTLETEFERSVIGTIDNPASMIQKYKESLVRNDWCSLLDESVVTPNFPLLGLYRIRRKPEENTLKTALKLLRNEGAYACLRTIIRYEDDIKAIGRLIPIVKLTNYLLDVFNLKITREEARSTAIGVYAKRDEVLAGLLEEFLEAWQGIGEVQYQCHLMKALELTKESELMYFLPDARELGGGTYMSAALETLASKQNKLLISLQEILGKGCFKGSCPVQKLPPNSLFPQLALPYDLTTCTTNPAYGSGQDISFDFSSLETAAISPLKHCYYLDTSSLTFIQYHLELMNFQGKESGLISSLREKIGENEDEKTFKEWLKAVMYKENKTQGERFGSYLRAVTGELEMVMCLLKSDRFSRNEELKAACERLEVVRYAGTLLDSGDLGKVEVRHIVCLYDYLEVLYFPYMTQYVQLQFKDADDSGLAKRTTDRVMTAAENGETLPYFEDIEKAYMKMIMRCLTADLKASDPQSLYIAKGDFWPSGTSEEAIENLQYHLGDLPLALALVTFDYIRQYNNTHLNRRLTESLD